MKIKDICKAATNFGVQNLLLFSSKNGKLQIRLTGNNAGPTFTFRVKEFVLNKDLQNKLPRNKILNATQLKTPIVLCKGFDGEIFEFSQKLEGFDPNLEKYLPVLKSAVKNLYPNIRANPHASLQTAKRAVLFFFNRKLKVLEVRNYYIKKAHSGLNKKIKKLLNNNKLLDFGNLGDVSEMFLDQKVDVSDSDVDNLQTKIKVDQKLGGEVASTEVNLRLYEIGPRVTMELFKVQEGFLEGEVLYHAVVSKTEEEKEGLRKKVAAKEKLRQERREEQERNVARKKEEQELRKKKLLGKRRRFKEDGDSQKNNSKEDGETAELDQNFENKETGNQNGEIYDMDWENEMPEIESDGDSKTGDSKRVKQE